MTNDLVTLMRSCFGAQVSYIEQGIYIIGRVHHCRLPSLITPCCDHCRVLIYYDLRYYRIPAPDPSPQRHFQQQWTKSKTPASCPGRTRRQAHSTAKHRSSGTSSRTSPMRSSRRRKGVTTSTCHMHAPGVRPPCL
jgi:hypothetical protein